MMDWFVVILSLLIAAGTIWGIQFFFKRVYREIGQIICQWYTGPAISGIVILGLYTIGVLYLYCTSFTPNYLLLFPFGLIVLGFYYYFGRAAIGSAGVFINGRVIAWNTIYNYQLTETWGKRLRWQFHWRESSAPAGDRSTAVIIPASHRPKAEEVIRTTLENQSDDSKK
jgi:hypothetical protein